MNKKIFAGVSLLLAVAVVCFGAIFLTLYLIDSEDEKPFVSTLQSNVEGLWYAISCEPVEEGGLSFDSEGKSFEFTAEFIMKYYENGAEVLDKRAKYSWINETKMLLDMISDDKERTFQISFDNSQNLLVQDIEISIIWTLSKTKPVGEDYISPFHDRLLGIWNAIYCERNGSEFPFEGKTFVFNSDMKLFYYENGFEVTDKSCIFSWVSETILILKGVNEEREWILSTNEEGNLIVKDESYGLIWTLKKG